ncbi:hypothetical protein H5410_040021 [Solanum commersonii]|uniref:Uncharacterized protein n=1 Tax=Solanum commersonii TaxID=4109 RepID=A0A9J5XMN6_SOLCO|nr:hypothetical protein H5410_040021 [Solanum commersonii]
MYNLYVIRGCLPQTRYNSTTCESRLPTAVVHRENLNKLIYRSRDTHYSLVANNFSLLQKSHRHLRESHLKLLIFGLSLFNFSFSSFAKIIITSTMGIFYVEA